MQSIGDNDDLTGTAPDGDDTKYLFRHVRRIMNMLLVTLVHLALAFSSGYAFQATTKSSQGPSSLQATKHLGEPTSNRRDAIKASGLILASLLMGEKAQAENPQTILITGANSGYVFFCIVVEYVCIIKDRMHCMFQSC